MSYEWVAFLLFCISTFLYSLLALGLLKTIAPKLIGNLQALDWPIELALSIVAVITFVVGEFYFGIENIILYGIAYGFAGVLLEYSADWLWHKLMGSRLYVYFKEPWMKFTTWWNFPYWAMGSLVFIGLFQIFELSASHIDPWEFLVSLSGFGFIGLALYIVVVSIIDGFDGKLDNPGGFSWLKYLLMLSILWFGIIGGSLYLGYPELILYFVITSVLGTVGEGTLGYVLKLFFGERFWYYTKFPIMNLNTSLLIVPIWPIASAIALVVWLFVVG